MKKILLFSALLSFTATALCSSSEGDKKRDVAKTQQKKLTPEEERIILINLIRDITPYDKFVQIINDNNIDVNREPTRSDGTLLRKYASGYLGYNDFYRRPEYGEEQAIPYIKFLLSKGADPNLVSLNTTPLESAGNTEIARLLLDYGANPNISGNPKLKNALNYFKLKQAEVAKAYKNDSIASAWADSRMKIYQQFINLLEPLTIPQPIDDKEIADLIAAYAVPPAPPAPGAQEILEFEQKTRTDRIPQAPELTAEQEQAISQVSRQAEQKRAAQWTSDHDMVAERINSNFPKIALDLIVNLKKNIKKNFNEYAKNDKEQMLYDIARAAKKTREKQVDWDKLMELLRP